MNNNADCCTEDDANTTLYTPGPWNLYGYTIVSKSDDIARVCALPGEANHPHVRQEQRANASLLAAAPELLDALQLATDRLQLIADELVRYGGVLWKHEIDQCNAAIAKARQYR